MEMYTFLQHMDFSPQSCSVIFSLQILKDNGNTPEQRDLHVDRQSECIVVPIIAPSICLLIKQNKLESNHADYNFISKADLLL